MRFALDSKTLHLVQNIYSAILLVCCLISILSEFGHQRRRFAENVSLSQWFLNDWNIISCRRWKLNSLVCDRTLFFSSIRTGAVSPSLCVQSLALIEGEIVSHDEYHHPLQARENFGLESVNWKGERDMDAVCQNKSTKYRRSVAPGLPKSNL